MNLDLHHAVISAMITNELVTNALPRAPVRPERVPTARRRRWPRWPAVRG